MSRFALQTDAWLEVQAALARKRIHALDVMTKENQERTMAYFAELDRALRQRGIGQVRDVR